MKFMTEAKKTNVNLKRHLDLVLGWQTHPPSTSARGELTNFFEFLPLLWYYITFRFSGFSGQVVSLIERWFY